MRLRRLGRIENDLRSSPSVAQVDEDEAAVVTAARHPTVELHLATFVIRPDRTAMGRREPAHASLSGSSAQLASACSPLAMSFSWAAFRPASSALKSTTHRAP